MFGKNVPQIPHVHKSVHWTLFYSVQQPSWLPSCKEDIAMPKVPKLIYIGNLAYITAKKSQPDHVYSPVSFTKTKQKMYTSV